MTAKYLSELGAVKEITREWSVGAIELAYGQFMEGKNAKDLPQAKGLLDELA
jgi:hypothetical protein